MTIDKDNLGADERIAQLEAALKPFSNACDYAQQMTDAARLHVMDARDFFMWQSSRKLCVADFKDAKKALEKSKCQ